MRQHATPCQFNTSASWVILSPIEKSIKEKIEHVGTPLKDWDVKIYRGILTGCNEAFIIDEAKRRELIAQDPKSAEIIRPILRGRDIKRYGYNWAGLYLIATHNGVPEKSVLKIDIKKYPAIKAHLDSHWEQIEKRADQGDTPYHLRSCAYMDDFSKPKIVWGNLALSAQFAAAPEGMFVNAPCPMIVPFNGYLLAVLNSKLGDWYIRQLGVTRNGGYFEYKPMFVEKLPVPLIDPKEQAVFASMSASPTKANQHAIDKMVFGLFNLSQEEVDVVSK